MGTVGNTVAKVDAGEEQQLASRRKLPERELQLVDGRLRAFFPYNTEAVAAMRSIKGARFDKTLRCWSLPLAALPLLEKSVFFCRTQLYYRFTNEEAHADASAILAERRAAEARLMQNPFAVSREDLSLLDLDVRFELTDSGDAIKGIASRRSAARAILEAHPGTHYLRKERCYWIGAAQFNALLCALRDARVRLAVEKELGERLSHSARIRERLRDRSAGDTGAVKEELLQALLTPIVDVAPGSESNQSPVFELSGYSAPQLTAVLGGGVRKEKRRTASSLTAAGLLAACFEAERAGITLWFTGEATAALRRAAAEVVDEAGEEAPDWLPLLKVPERLLCLLPSGEPACVCSTTDVVPELPFDSFHPLPLNFCGESGWYAPLSEEVLWELVGGDGPTCALPVSAGVRALLERIARRKAALARQSYYASLADAEVPGLAADRAAVLFPHQRVAVRWLQEHAHAFLGDDMGLGKTLSVLTAFSLLKAEGEVEFLLVVCPNSLTRNWAREAAHWTPEVTLSLLPPKRKEQDTILATQADGLHGLALNYELFRLPRVLGPIKELCQAKRVMLVVDESQRAKNPTSATFRALDAIAPLCARKVLLSGTPAPRDIGDLWAQLKLLDDGERLGTSYYSWLKEVAELGTSWSEFAVRRYRPEAVAKVRSAVQELLLRRRKEEVIALPEKLFSVRDVILGSDQQKRYDEVRRELLVRMTHTNGETFTRELHSILEQFLRAVQMASNPRLVDPHWRGEPAKFTELDEIVQEVVAEQGRQLVIWTNYRLNVAELCERYAHLGAGAFTGLTPTEERERLLREFQLGENSPLKILIAIPAAGGVGVTLTSAQTAVYLDKTWNGEHWLQSVDRLHRIGQRGVVNIISLHACPVDEAIYRNLQKKALMQEKLLERGEFEEVPSREELMEAVSTPA